MYTMYNMSKTVMVHQQKQYKFYNHNLSTLFQATLYAAYKLLAPADG